MIGFYNYTVILTYISAASSLLGIRFAILGNIKLAIICLMIAGFCDMFDGKIARLNTTRDEYAKEFGLQIDSLCDVISFGVFPGVINIIISNGSYLSITISIVYVICAVIRLGYFNVMELNATECRSFYQGLPVTSAAILVPCMYLLSYFQLTYFTLLFNVYMLIIAMLFITNFKIYKLKIKGNVLILIAAIFIFVGIIRL